MLSETFSLDYIDKNILKTLDEMMVDRGYKGGYQVGKEDDVHYLIYKEPKRFTYYIFFCLEEDLNIKALDEYLHILTENGIKRCIIVYNNNVTPKVKSTVDMMTYPIELFKKSEMMFNITKHILVPTHIALKNSEKQLLKEVNKFPYILSTDPISRYYAFKKGQVIKIIRKDGYVTYRVVK